jgi:hypothetical protein
MIRNPWLLVPLVALLGVLAAASTLRPGAPPAPAAVVADPRPFEAVWSDRALTGTLQGGAMPWAKPVRTERILP